MSSNFGWASSSVSPDSAIEDLPIEGQEGDEEERPEVRTRTIMGSAGSGKTYQVKKEIEEDPTSGILCATTGIAAVNLGATTIHSLLKYFDTDSLQQAYIRGRLVTNLANLAKSYKQLILDEFPMLSGDQLDTIYHALSDANARASVRNSKNPEGMGMTLVGDFAQLPAVKCKQPYQAECWPMFEKNIEKLTHNWRQGSGTFLQGINQIRVGNGAAGAELLKKAGVEFATINMIEFPGTTILAKNVDVDRFNWVALSKVPGDVIKVQSEKWLYGYTKAPGEWRFIPEELQVKIGAYVMILANDFQGGYANGDTGHIQEYDPLMKVFSVKLVRNDRVVFVPQIERRVQIKDDPITLLDDQKNTSLIYSKKMKANMEPLPWGEPYYDEVVDKYIAGSVKFSPVRLAYASTVNKSQGLSLDRVQMDIRQAFFGSPAMCYVAVSRCKTAEGLRIVGDVSLLAKRTKVNEEVRKWL